MKTFKVNSDFYSEKTESAFDDAYDYMSMQGKPMFSLTEVMIDDRRISKIIVFDKIEGALIVAVTNPKALLKAYKNKKFTAAEILEVKNRLQALVS